MYAELIIKYTPMGIGFQSNIPTNEWLSDHRILHANAQALGLFVLQLFEEELLAQETAELISLPWEAYFIICADPVERESLEAFIPPPALAQIRPKLNHDNSLADQNFSVALGWVDSQGQRLSSQAIRTGAIITINDKEFLLSEAAWQLCEAVTSFAKLPSSDKSRSSNERAWSKMRKLALRAGASMDDFLERTIILSPEKLKINTRQTEVSGSKVIEIVPVIEEVEEDRWLRTFDGVQKVQGHYDIALASGGLMRIIIEPSVKAVLGELKKYPGRRVAGDRARAFLRNPNALLGEDAATAIDETQFQEAIAEAGIEFYTFTHKRRNDVANRICAVDIILNLESEGLGHPPICLSLDTPEQLETFISEIVKKRSLAMPCCVWEGFELVLRGDTDDQILQLRQILMDWHAAEPAMPEHSDTPLVSHAEVYDFTRYVPRVEGIGTFKPIYSPYIAKKKQEQGWIPDNVIFGLSDEEGNVDIAADIDQQEPIINSEDLIKAEEGGKSTIQLPDGSSISVEEAKLHSTLRDKILKGLNEGRPPSAEGSSWKEGEIKSKKRVGLLIKQNIITTDYEENRKDQLAFSASGKVELPKTLKADKQLMPHQLEGVEWLQHLWRNRAEPVHVRGCIYADDMGLGKTLQLLTFIGSYFESSHDSRLPVLIVAPVALLDNWVNEIKRFFTDDFGKILVLHGDGLQQRRLAREHVDAKLQSEGITTFLIPDWLGDADIVLTTYEVLRDQEFSLSSTKFSIMICDEAQKIKSPSAIVTKAAKAQNAEFKIACTGTPVENSLADLWCLYDFIQPGFLGALNDFSRRYRRPIEAEDTNDDAEKARIKDTIEELRQKISDQTLRRTKVEMRIKFPEHISLKDKLEDDKCRELPLSKRQKELYSQAIETYKTKRQMGLDGMLDPRQAGAAILGMLHHLRQICADPRPMGLKPDLSIPFDTYSTLSPKMKWLIETLTTIKSAGEKVLIFTEFKDIQVILRHYIQDQFGFRPEIINGDPIKAPRQQKVTRQKLIDSFQDSPGFGVLILSPVAVGFGVNIQAANHVIHYTRCWNPAKEDQATDRAYRIGQKRNVMVYYPTVHSPEFLTFERRLDNILSFKRRLAGDMLNGAEDVSISELTDGIGLQSSGNVVDFVTSDNLERLDGAAFEKLCMILWRKQGYHANLNSRRPQGGVDIIGLKNDEGVLIQCKSSSRANAKLGREALGDVIMDFAEFSNAFPKVRFKKIAATNQHFNDAVKERAKINAVELIERQQILDLLKRSPVQLAELLI